MNQELTEKCQLLAENYLTVGKAAKFEWPEALQLGALVFTEQGLQADVETIRANRALLKEKVGCFNCLRGDTSISLIAKMCLADDPAAYLDKVIEAYNAVTAGKIFTSQFLANAAIAMADYADPENFEEIVTKGREILDKMHHAHPLLTNDEDTTYALLLAIAGIDADEALAEAERCYEILKHDGFALNKDTLQSVTMILALNPKPAEEKCARFNEIRHALKASGSKVSSLGLPIIAAYVNTDVPTAEIVAEVAEADEYLKHLKGFKGICGCGSQMRRVLAGALILQSHTQSGTQIAAGSAVASMIVEEIILTIVMIIIFISIETSINSSQI